MSETINWTTTKKLQDLTLKAEEQLIEIRLPDHGNISLILDYRNCKESWY